MEDNCKAPAAFLMEYADGLRTVTLMLNGHLRGWGYAGRSAGQVHAMETYLSDDPHPHFVYMGLNIHEMFVTGKPQYPVERTLLISGALESLLDSRHRGHVRVETPHLDVSYRSYEKLPIRPTNPRPTGPSATPWRSAE